MRNINKILLITIVFVLFTGCLAQPSKKVNLGYMEGSKYINEYFGLEVEIPEEWDVMSEEEKMEIVRLGTDIAIGDDEELRKMIEKGKMESLFLLSAYKYRDRKISEFNPNISCIAEYLSGFFNSDNAKEYLEYKREDLLDTQMSFKFEKEIYVEDVGGNPFYVLETYLEFRGDEDLSNLIVTQKYYVKIINNYAISFIISYSNEIEKEELEQILNSIILR